jgi:hypothetical protein
MPTLHDFFFSFPSAARAVVAALSEPEDASAAAAAEGAVRLERSAARAWWWLSRVLSVRVMAFDNARRFPARSASASTAAAENLRVRPQRVGCSAERTTLLLTRGRRHWLRKELGPRGSNLIVSILPERGCVILPDEGQRREMRRREGTLTLVISMYTFSRSSVN